MSCNCSNSTVLLQMPINFNVFHNCLLNCLTFSGYNPKLISLGARPTELNLMTQKSTEGHLGRN